MTTAKNIYVSRDDQRFGPYSFAEIREYLQQGRLLESDLSWHEGQDGWMPLSTLGLNSESQILPRPSAPAAVLPPLAATSFTAPTPMPDEDAVALWNPSAAGNWSLFTSPLFGALLVRANHKALGNKSAANRSLIWAVVAGLQLTLLLFETKSVWLGFWLWVFWYSFDCYPQMKLVKANFGKNYRHRGWGLPLLWTAAGIVTYFCILGFLMSLRGELPQ